MDRIVQLIVGTEAGIDRLFPVSAESFNGPVLGHFSVTPLVGGLSCEFRLNFHVQSSKFGYYSLSADGSPFTRAVPVNQPLQTNFHLFSDYSNVSLVFYDLDDIVVEDRDFSGIGWEFLLNQKWFHVDSDSPVSLRLRLLKVGELGGVHYGNLFVLED